jgi:hypothetical protein
MQDQLIQVLSESELKFDFGDERLNRRASRLIEDLSKNSGKSLPQAFCNGGDLRGAYRFFSNSQISPKAILEPHKEETIRRCKTQKVVLSIQDSSDLDFDYMTCLEGFNSLHSTIEKGYRIHPCLVTTEEGTPLGVLASFDYNRPLKEERLGKHRNSLTIEQKESYRWLQGYREACKLKAKSPHSQVISIADREADIYECFLEATTGKGQKADILIRAQHNRNLVNEGQDTDKIEKKLIRSPILTTATIQLHQYQKTERIATIAIRATTVTIKAPNTCKKKQLAPITINAVLISEIDPPKDAGTTVDWLLLTTLPIDNQEDALRIIKLYAKRWSIEVYFKVLKSGCRIDQVRFQNISNIKRYIALMMLVAWKVMLTTYLPREYPDEPCSILFTDIEWRLVFRRVYKDKPFPNNEPTLKEVVTLVAMLGGYQKRKEPPGIQTVWNGIICLLNMVYGYEIAQEVVISRKKG